MPTTSQGLEVGAKLLKNAALNIESYVLKSPKGKLDEKTLSVVSRLKELLERLANALEAVAKAVGSTDRDIVALSQYTYVYRTNSRVVLTRNKPEYVALSYDAQDNAVSLKVRDTNLTLSQKSISVSYRGISATVDAYSADQLKERRDELRVALNALERTAYGRLIPFLEQKVIKKAL
ncbi:MAG: hypothetical protein QXK88_04630 [Desulfurococcaceae archaeon]